MRNKWLSNDFNDENAARVNRGNERRLATTAMSDKFV
jgi:hypothetical protein